MKIWQISDFDYKLNNVQFSQLCQNIVFYVTVPIHESKNQTLEKLDLYGKVVELSYSSAAAVMVLKS